MSLADVPWAEHLRFGFSSFLVIAGHGAGVCATPHMLWPSDELWGVCSEGQLGNSQPLESCTGNTIFPLPGSSSPGGPLKGGPQGGGSDNQAVGLWDRLLCLLPGGPKQHCSVLKIEVILWSADVQGLCQCIAVFLKQTGFEIIRWMNLLQSLESKPRHDQSNDLDSLARWSRANQFWMPNVVTNSLWEQRSFAEVTSWVISE